MAPVVFPYTGWLLAYFLPLISVKGPQLPSGNQQPIWMVTDTGAWSEIVHHVLQPGEGHAARHTQRYTWAREDSSQRSTRIRAVGEVLIPSASLYPQATGGCSSFHTGRKWQRASTAALISVKRTNAALCQPSNCIISLQNSVEQQL